MEQAATTWSRTISRVLLNAAFRQRPKTSSLILVAAPRSLSVSRAEIAESGISFSTTCKPARSFLLSTVTVAKTHVTYVLY